MNFFIADTHFYHKNIIIYASRPFRDVEEMNEKIIENWNSRVKPRDTVYHLGDFAMCSNTLLSGIMDRLNGKILLVRGNHDNRNMTAWQDLGFTVLRCPPIELKKEKILLSHYPLLDTQIPEGWINVHGHIHDKMLNACVYHNREGGLENEFPKRQYSPEKHICVSVERINYTPQTLEEVLALPRDRPKE